jgi:undecaprenyl-diphosphatase
MTLAHAFLLALVQALTEFIPVSSSGHLVLCRRLFGISDAGGIMFDIVLHAGSLLAVLLYFWRDWARFGQSVFDPDAPERSFYLQLPLLLLIATAPLVLAGPFLAPAMEAVRSPRMVGAVMLAAAAWFVLCERLRKTERPFRARTALFMGLAQVFAMLPGASRSGLTTGAGLVAGRPRTDAARFSFFMLIPAVTGAIVYESPAILGSQTAGFRVAHLVTGFAVSFAASLGAIHFCLRFFRRHSLTGFAVYLAVLGTLLLFL